ncbi:MAG: glutamine-hydrolyzing carbamoyl-phosphate synthase small subunit [bacterium]|nr:glutamine-hydrolyzing carbamoyl-phosphate synthase small subunit [bacterium]
MEALLILEDGREFRGRSFGAPGERTGEVVFNTSMAGYQEILTDPSYRGQIVTMTCPEIGNCGTNGLDEEADGPQVEGFVVREASPMASNWRAHQDLPRFLREHGIPGICEIDTRALTRHIRSRGAMKGILSTVDRDRESLRRKACAAPGLDEVDLVDRVTCKSPYEWNEAREPRWRTELAASTERRYRLVAYDFGMKRNILKLLNESGFDVTVVPAGHPAEETLALEPDAVFLSNGPGDPTVPGYAIEAVRGLVGRVPVFGICLGHQIAALALGGRTFKLKFGHRGANHPVRDERDGTVAVTSQNHGYAVDPDSLPEGSRVTHLNLNDGTCEGFVLSDKRLFAVQHHPEASPGPHDSIPLFDEFRAMVQGSPEPPPALEEKR